MLTRLASPTIYLPAVTAGYTPTSSEKGDQSEPQSITMIPSSKAPLTTEATSFGPPSSLVNISTPPTLPASNEVVQSNVFGSNQFATFTLHWECLQVKWLIHALKGPEEEGRSSPHKKSKKCNELYVVGGRRNSGRRGRGRGPTL